MEEWSYEMLHPGAGGGTFDPAAHPNNLTGAQSLPWSHLFQPTEHDVHSIWGALGAGEKHGRRVILHGQHGYRTMPGAGQAASVPNVYLGPLANDHSMTTANMPLDGHRHAETAEHPWSMLQTTHAATSQNSQLANWRAWFYRSGTPFETQQDARGPAQDHLLNSHQPSESWDYSRLVHARDGRMDEEFKKDEAIVLDAQTTADYRNYTQAISVGLLATAGALALLL